MDKFIGGWLILVTGIAQFVYWVITRERYSFLAAIGMILLGMFMLWRM